MSYKLFLQKLAEIPGEWNYSLSSPDGVRHSFCGCTFDTAQPEAPVPVELPESPEIPEP